jgi:hypothetical protein
VPSRAAILCAAGGKALTTEHWSTGLRFEGDAVALAALIANNLEPFAFCSSLARTAKVLASRVPAGFATLGVAQTTLAIIVLFAFSKGKSRLTFGTSDFKVWHRYLPRKILFRLVSKLVRRVYRTLARLYRGVREPSTIALQLLHVSPYRFAQRLQIVAAFHA